MSENALEATPRRRGLLPLGRIIGVPVYLAWSWALIALFVVVMFGPQVQRLFPELGAGAYGIAFLYAVLLLLSVLVHEFAHALTARIFRWPTTEIVLNLWGGHTQFGSFEATPGRSLVTALAGPAANVVLALGGQTLMATWQPDGVADLLLGIFTYANWLVAIFNALPGLPLDGGRIVESAVWAATGDQDRGSIAAGWAGRGIVVLLAVGVVVIPMLQGRPADLSLIVILVLVGYFLWSGATESIRGAEMRLRVPRLTAGQLMRPAIGLPSTATVAEVLARPTGTRTVLVSATGQPEAIVDETALSSVPPEEAASVPAAATARALPRGAIVRATEAGRPLVDRLATVEGTEYAVLALDGSVCGVLHQPDVVEWLTTGHRR
ncbi:site-2 protease family protein [Citricoccus sp. GCM10030269]|uniref:site-2 protease family protein n=1 Tax=Citricoccus sp. GCM10030269 TaxID=3273388 RepID=UPI00360E77AE